MQNSIRMIPNSFQTPNAILDVFLSGKCIDIYELVLLLIVARKTIGWGKIIDGISLSQFTKISRFTRKTVLKKLKSLLKKNLIRKTVVKKENGCYEYSRYSLAEAFLKGGVPDINNPEAPAVTRLENQPLTNPPEVLTAAGTAGFGTSLFDLLKLVVKMIWEHLSQRCPDGREIQPVVRILEELIEKIKTLETDGNKKMPAMAQSTPLPVDAETAPQPLETGISAAEASLPEQETSTSEAESSNRKREEVNASITAAKPDAPVPQESPVQIVENTAAAIQPLCCSINTLPPQKSAAAMDTAVVTAQKAGSSAVDPAGPEHPASVPQAPKAARSRKKSAAKQPPLSESPYADLLQLSIELIQNNHPHLRFSDKDKREALDMFDKLVRLDGKTPAEIEAALRYAAGHHKEHFSWAKQYQSLNKPRKRSKTTRHKFIDMWISEMNFSKAPSTPTFANGMDFPELLKVIWNRERENSQSDLPLARVMDGRRRQKALTLYEDNKGWLMDFIVDFAAAARCCHRLMACQGDNSISWSATIDSILDQSGIDRVNANYSGHIVVYDLKEYGQLLKANGRIPETIQTEAMPAKSAPVAVPAPVVKPPDPPPAFVEAKVPAPSASETNHNLVKPTVDEPVNDDRAAPAPKALPYQSGHPKQSYIEPVRQKLLQLALRLIQEHHPTACFSEKEKERAMLHFENMILIEKKTPEQMEAVLRHAGRHHFHDKAYLALGRFRERHPTTDQWLIDQWIAEMDPADLPPSPFFANEKRFGEVLKTIWNQERQVADSPVSAAENLSPWNYHKVQVLYLLNRKRLVDFVIEFAMAARCFHCLPECQAMNPYNDIEPALSQDNIEWINANYSEQLPCDGLAQYPQLLKVHETAETAEAAETVSTAQPSQSDVNTEQTVGSQPARAPENKSAEVPPDIQALEAVVAERRKKTDFSSFGKAMDAFFTQISDKGLAVNSDATYQKSPYFGLLQLSMQLIQKNHPDIRFGDREKQGALYMFEQLIRGQGRTPQQIEAALRYAANHHHGGFSWAKQYRWICMPWERSKTTGRMFIDIWTAEMNFAASSKKPSVKPGMHFPQLLQDIWNMEQQAAASALPRVEKMEMQQRQKALALYLLNKDRLEGFVLDFAAAVRCCHRLPGCRKDEPNGVPATIDTLLEQSAIEEIKAEHAALIQRDGLDRYRDLLKEREG